MSELYLAMGRLICAFVLIVGVLAALWLAVSLTANWEQKRIDEAATTAAWLPGTAAESVNKKEPIPKDRPEKITY